MRASVRRRLLDINRAFYQSHGRSFAETRPRAQPGVDRLLSRVPGRSAVLDLGCGHGLAAAVLAKQGHHGLYLGLDADETLIAEAARRVQAPWAQFRTADLASPRWSRGVAPTAPAAFAWVLAFAVLHHLPGETARRRLARQVRALQPEEGSLAVSVWDFMESGRLRARVVPWAEVGLDPGDLEPGDNLLDWRRDGRGLRYVHHFTSSELDRLAHASGYRVVEEFRSDGEGGRLGLYQLWRCAPDSAW